MILRGLKLLQAYHRTLAESAGDGKKALEILSEYEGKLNMEEKLDLVRSGGGLCLWQ